MSSLVLPEHMDRWSRSQRLYETLKGMGLFVTPIPEIDDPTRIRELIVSVDLPVQHTAENSAQAGVSRAVQGPDVGKIVTAAERDGDNVVDFPTVVRIPVAVVGVSDGVPEGIAPPNRLIANPKVIDGRSDERGNRGPERTDCY